MATETSCENNPVLDPNEPIKGHVFAAERIVGILEFEFKKDMSVEYRWQNSWEQAVNTRTDLTYSILSETNFNILSEDNSIWGEGEFHNEEKPYILISNFAKDTLYLKK